MLATANRHYRSDPRTFLLLTLDLDRVGSAWRFDDPGRIYPHIYGPIDPASVDRVTRPVRVPDGTFVALETPAAAPCATRSSGARSRFATRRSASDGSRRGSRSPGRRCPPRTAEASTCSSRRSMPRRGRHPRHRRRGADRRGVHRRPGRRRGEGGRPGGHRRVGSASRRRRAGADRAADLEPGVGAGGATCRSGGVRGSAAAGAAGRVHRHGRGHRHRGRRRCGGRRIGRRGDGPGGGARDPRTERRQADALQAGRSLRDHCASTTTWSAVPRTRPSTSGGSWRRSAAPSKHDPRHVDRTVLRACGGAGGGGLVKRSGRPDAAEARKRAGPVYLCERYFCRPQGTSTTRDGLSSRRSGVGMREPRAVGAGRRPCPFAARAGPGIAVRAVSGARSGPTRTGGAIGRLSGARRAATHQLGPRIEPDHRLEGKGNRTAGASTKSSGTAAVGTPFGRRVTGLVS